MADKPVRILTADEVAVLTYKQLLETALDRPVCLPEALAALAEHWSGPRTMKEAGV